MKKVLAAIATLLAIIIISVASFLIGVAINGMSPSIGTILIASTGDYILLENDMPIALSSRFDNSEMFNGLTNGDVVLVVHDGILESYPAQTSVTSVIKLKDGDIGDVPQHVLDGLIELGWWSNQDATQEPVVEEPTEPELVRPGIQESESEIVDPDVHKDENFTIYESAVTWTDCINYGLLLPISMNHNELETDEYGRPVVKIESKNDIKVFSDYFIHSLSSDFENDNKELVDDFLASFDDQHFEENIVFLIYSEVNSLNDELNICNLVKDDDELCFYIDQIQDINVAEGKMFGRWIVCSVRRDVINNCTKFHAKQLACEG